MYIVQKSQTSLSFFSSFPLDRGLLFPRIPQTHYVVWNDLIILILLPPSPKGWDYRNIPPQLVCTMLGIKARPSYRLGNLAPV